MCLLPDSWKRETRPHKTSTFRGMTCYSQSHWFRADIDLATRCRARPSRGTVSPWPSVCVWYRNRPGHRDCASMDSKGCWARVGAAQASLGVYYANLQTPQGDTEAAGWYRKAAEQGFAVAQYLLGGMYEDGRGVSQSDSQTAGWYQQAAEQGYTGAQYTLGNRFEEGRGVTKSDTQAARWYQKAAEQGEACAQTSLGIMYAFGRGVPQSDAEAVRWYRKAAEGGDGGGQLLLAGAYEYGRGVPKDTRTALAWYQKAAEQGNSTAEKAWRRLRSGSGRTA